MATPSASLLRAFARYMKEHPDIPEEQVIEVFAGNGRSEEEATLALATPESCATTGRQPIPKRATVRYPFVVGGGGGRLVVSGRLTGSVDQHRL